MPLNSSSLVLTMCVTMPKAAEGGDAVAALQAFMKLRFPFWKHFRPNEKGCYNNASYVILRVCSVGKCLSQGKDQYRQECVARRLAGGLHLRYILRGR